MWVDEVGTGVGYIEARPWSSRATRFWGRGSEGDELNGSNAGNRDAGRFTPATEAVELLLGGEDSMVTRRVYATAPTRPHGTLNKPRRDNTLQLKRWGGDEEGFASMTRPRKGPSISIDQVKQGKREDEWRQVKRNEP